MGVGQDLNLFRLSASPTSLPLGQGQGQGQCRNLPVHQFLNHKKTGKRNPTTHSQSHETSRPVFTSTSGSKAHSADKRTHHFSQIKVKVKLQVTVTRIII